MKFGTSIPERLLMQAAAEGRQDKVVRVLRAIEEAGFEWLRVGDHVAHPGISHHESEDLEKAVYGDPFSVISWLSSLNLNLKLILGVLILPFRHPVLVAHAAATVDRLSGGRFILGLGAGYSRQEFAALDIDYDERYARTEDHIKALRTLLTEKRASFDGRFTKFQDVSVTCRPLQKRLPLWIGGVGPKSIDRVARLGDCWFLSVSGYGRPPGLTPRDLATRGPEVQARRKEFGLDPIEIIASTAVGFSFRTDPQPLDGPAEVRDRHVNGSGTVEDFVDLVRAYEEAGLEGIVIDMHTEDSLDGCLRAIDVFAERIKPHFPS